MNTLTKICIVLVFVLALLSCVVFYQEVSTASNWKAYARSQNQRAALAETEVRNQMLAVHNWQTLYNDVKKRVTNLERSSQKLLDDKQAQIRKLDVQNTELLNRLNGMDARLTNMAGSLKRAVDRNKMLSDHLQVARDDKIKTENELRHKLSKIKELEAEIETTLAARRVQDGRISELEQEVADLVHKISDMETRGVAAGGVKGAEDVPVGDKIDATVMAVRDSLASLNVGSASRIKKGMVFILYRGAEFVGNIRIADVGTTNCAGVIFEAVKEVRIGDKATNKLD